MRESHMYKSNDIFLRKNKQTVVFYLSVNVKDELRLTGTR